MKRTLFTLSLAASAALSETFSLGQINVLNTPIEASPFESTVSEDAIDRDTAQTVAEALDTVSGINADIQGGRAESTLYVRGFDARRVGVFIDGVPVYVPYDGNFDYARFLTTDIAQIDISKGYSSVAYGANTMGGVINILSKKPTETLEGDIKGGMRFDSDGGMVRRQASFNVGSRQAPFYLQLGGNYSEQTHFRLSDDFDGSADQPEGDRLRSASKDYKVTLKAGYLGDDGSEIAIGYANQNGEKQQPPAADSEYSRTKYWDWPYWDKETLYLNAQKPVGDGYLKAVAYYDAVENSLYSYADAAYNSFNSFGRTFKSRYDDFSNGARLEYGLETQRHFLSLSANYKKDLHRAYDISKTDNSESLAERYEDTTLSFGIEDLYTLNAHWQILGGISYDRKEGDAAWDTASSTEKIPLGSQETYNPQAAVIFTPDAHSKLRASVSRKSYLTSMKDRYSRRLGTAEPNPDLKSEKATHYELSYQGRLQTLSGRVNAFYTQVEDAIESVIVDPVNDISQNQNVGSFDHRGVEFEMAYRSASTELGGNYTYLSLINTEHSDVKRTDVPRHQLFAYVDHQLGGGFSLYGNMRWRKGAWEQKLNGSYAINPMFKTFDVKLAYQATKALRAEAGITNLTDENYAYDRAFPMPGREYFATLGYRF